MGYLGGKNIEEEEYSSAPRELSDTVIDPSSFPPKYVRTEEAALNGLSGSIKLGRADNLFP